MIPEKVPRHIGVILDGNRRFAKKLVMKPWMGHDWGAKKIRQFLDWSRELGVQEVTAYCFSMQNFNRPKQEFDFLMDTFDKEFTALSTPEQVEELRKNGVRINFIGRIGMFPENIQKGMRTLMGLTKENKPFVANFAMAYGGREEVIDAAKKLGEDIKAGKVDIEKLNEEVFGKYLYLNSEPDLIIRTGGEHRTSNFLIWQSHYSEWFFVDKTWPEMEKEDLVKVIQEFSQRERRFGK
jgi:tritrans,polycis-undecaprenyl-diphosphate synthase [geranylgeranyl-diphosphate specific]